MLMTGAPAWLGAELASTVGIFSLCAHLNLWWNGRKKEKERRKRVLDAYRKWNSLCIDERRTLQIAWRVSSSSWLLPATFNNSWSTTQNIGAFQTKSTHIRQGLGRGGPEKSRLSFFTMAARRGPANTRSSYKRYRRYKKAHLCSSRSALLVASSSTGFIINEPKQVLSLSFSQIDQLPGGGRE
jgi:hypothetical protein